MKKAETRDLEMKNKSYVMLLTTALILMLITGVRGQDIAHRSPGGALLCPLVEDFYSYKRSTAYGPSRWGEISECCLGQRQSPRNLHSASPSICGQGHAVHFNYNSTMSIPGMLYNNGHDPTVVFHAYNTAHLFNAPFTTEPYVLDNIHVHFCNMPSKGSEHAIDGQFFQGEIHMVHFKASYGSLARAVLFEDGLVVIAVMIQSVSPQNLNVNHEMANIIGKMSHLQGVGKEFQLPIPVHVADIFPRSQAFFTYAGSMTSPPCSEAVRWIVLREPIYVSPREMLILWRLPNEDRGYIGNTCNDRPLQHGYTPVETNFECASFRGGEYVTYPHIHND